MLANAGELLDGGLGRAVRGLFAIGRGGVLADAPIGGGGGGGGALGAEGVARMGAGGTGDLGGVANAGRLAGEEDGGGGGGGAPGEFVAGG